MKRIKIIIIIIRVLCVKCFIFFITKIHVLLSLLFSMCLSHGYLPSVLIKTTIVPIVKNKAGDL